MSKRSAPNKDSTAASTLAKTSIVRIDEHKLKSGDTTQVHNKSGKTIFLIPIDAVDRASDSRTYSLAAVEAIEIAKESHVTLKSEDYVSKNQNIPRYLLFRAADKVNFKKYIDYLNNNGIKKKDGEVLWLCSKLKDSWNLDLHCAEEVDGNAGKVAEKGNEEDKEGVQKPVASENLVHLILEVLERQEGLKEDFKALAEKVEFLKEALELHNNLTKQH